MTIQADMKQFNNCPDLNNAKLVLKHKDKISAQCAFGPELNRADAIYQRFDNNSERNK